MHEIIRDEHGRLVPLVQPRRWLSWTLKRSHERAQGIADGREARKRRLATTRWLHELDRRGIAALEEGGIPWAAVQRWLDELEPREAFVARMVVKQALQALADDGVPQRERFERRNELYRRLMAAGIID